MGCVFTKEADEDDVFLKYDFGERLGQGGFGQVLVVTHKTTKHERAVKIIVRKEAEREGGSAAASRDLQAEGEIMAKMRHPNIVRLYDIYTDDLIIYLVMEKCNGGELFTKLEREICIVPDQAICITKQMVDAIAYVHANQIVHRDIKPENWLFSRKDSIEGLKLIDFGLAKVLEKDEKLNGPCGTLHYVAPETLAGSYEYQVDVWGLGVILYLMLFGFYPFDGANTKEIMKAIVKKRLEFPLDCTTRLSPTASSFLTGMLEKNPQKRLTPLKALDHRWLNEKDTQTKIGANVMKEARKTSVQVSVEPETERRRNEALRAQAKRKPSKDQQGFAGKKEGSLAKVVPDNSAPAGDMREAVQLDAKMVETLKGDLE